MSDSIKVLEQVIQQAGIRHGVITSNIANVDTPDYRAKDVTFGNVLNSEMRMAATNSKHLQGTESGAAGNVRTGDGQPWADKNNVELDLEVAKMTENAMLMQAGLTLLSKKILMFKTALRTR